MPLAAPVQIWSLRMLKLVFKLIKFLLTTNPVASHWSGGEPLQNRLFLLADDGQRSVTLFTVRPDRRLF